MQNRNVSDIIEKYLKSILADSKQIEIKRAEIAQQFDVVPSQINYVIKTRFNIQNGYIVESKRGGGGYIRIAKVNLANNVNIIDQLIAYIGEQIDARKGFQIIQSLYEDKVLTKKEANLILATIDSNTLSFANKDLEDTVRAKILISVLNRLRYEE
ncbi:CtsR family transcriptional regulator [Ligilactobacillus cholophilus]|uniref:CtsR family transcriptional regulator n=1 Tax=Ligilactobacillus cholophilus TaxID=3050131 RepID=UPI0025AF9DCE|nr:CtsR family transcriptional regulator [Ligilactobacillus cholophilus]